MKAVDRIVTGQQCDGTLYANIESPTIMMIVHELSGKIRTWHDYPSEYVEKLHNLDSQLTRDYTETVQKMKSLTIHPHQQQAASSTDVT